MIYVQCVIQIGCFTIIVHSRSCVLLGLSLHLHVLMVGVHDGRRVLFELEQWLPGLRQSHVGHVFSDISSTKFLPFDCAIDFVVISKYYLFILNGNIVRAVGYLLLCFELFEESVLALHIFLHLGKRH